MSFLAEAAALTGHPAADLYAALLPWEELAAADVGEGFGGSVGRYLALLAVTVGRPADARRHYDAALGANARMGARPWLAHTRARLRPTRPRGTAT